MLQKYLVSKHLALMVWQIGLPAFLTQPSEPEVHLLKSSAQDMAQWLARIDEAIWMRKVTAVYQRIGLQGKIAFGRRLGLKVDAVPSRKTDLSTRNQVLLQEYFSFVVLCDLAQARCLIRISWNLYSDKRGKEWLMFYSCCFFAYYIISRCNSLSSCFCGQLVLSRQTASPRFRLDLN